MRSLKYIFILILITTLSSCSEDTVESFGKGIITGTVVTDGANEPIANVKISTNPVTSTVFTDEEGNFIIENVPEGEYSVQAKKENLLTAFEGATVYTNTEVNVIFEMKKEIGNNKEPLTPIAIFPEDNATEVDVTLDFVWSSSDADGDMLTYELELRNDINNEVLKFEDIQDTTYTVEGLQNGLNIFGK